MMLPYAMHFDFHSMPGLRGIGKNFDAPRFARQLQEAKIKFVNLFAKDCNGFAYYPTQIGIVHPGLTRDILGEQLAACANAGIKVNVYLNGGYDNAALLQHPEWRKEHGHGPLAMNDDFYAPKEGNYLRWACHNTGYTDYLLAMMNELREHYHFNGFFMDCLMAVPCYCHQCLKKLRAKNADLSDFETHAAFARETLHNFYTRVSEAVPPEMDLYFNGIAYHRQRTHVEIEVLPNGSWGYDYLPMAIRYARTLGKPVYTMTGRFHNTWGDLNGLRSETSLEYDLAYSVANGCGMMVGDHLPPEAMLHDDVAAMMKKLYSAGACFDERLQDHHACAEILVIHPDMRDFPDLRFRNGKLLDTVPPEVYGVTRMLCELKMQFDISAGDTDLYRYKVIILPDSVVPDAALERKLRAFRGAIISSSEAWVPPDFPMKKLGQEPYYYNFIIPESFVAQSLGTLHFTNYEKGGVAVQALPGAEVLSRLGRPAFNRSDWDGEFANYYVPENGDSGRPSALQNGQRLYISIPLFSSYRHSGEPRMRIWFGNLLRRVLPHPMLEAENLPSFATATVTENTHSYFIHLLNFVPEHRGESHIVEDRLWAKDVVLRFRPSAAITGKAVLWPGGKPVTQDGQGNWEIGDFQGRALLEIFKA